jgi:ABC-2 type transport system permease protein
VAQTLLRRLRSNLGFASELVSRQLEASFALRGAFWLSVVLMFVNDLIFFSTWWILMARFGHVGGWRLDDMMCLYGITAAGYGLCVVVAGGISDLSRRIDEGDLDAFLTQPKSVLVQGAGKPHPARGWGDISVGVGLFALSGKVQLETVPALLIGVLCALPRLSPAASWRTAWRSGSDAPRPSRARSGSSR